MHCKRISNQFNKASYYKDLENELMSKINDLEINLYKKDTYKIVSEIDVATIINEKTKSDIQIYTFELSPVSGGLGSEGSIGNSSTANSQSSFPIRFLFVLSSDVGISKSISNSTSPPE